MKHPVNMTYEEILAELDRLGVPAGEWGNVSERFAPSHVVGRQQEILVRLRDMLEGLVAQDHQGVAKLREQLARIEFGGGS